MNRDQIVLLVIGAVVLLLAVSRGVITSQTILLFAVAIPSIILHEVSHGVVALGFGDDTAKRAGRITLNPMRHIDPLGTVIIPAILALQGLTVFGYAKPVPVSPNRMRHPRDDAVIVSLAGPATNIVLAGLAGLYLRLQHPVFVAVFAGPWRLRIPYAFGLLNVYLAVFNLIPIPPLDGSAVIQRFLPKTWQPGWNQLRRYGMWIVIGLVLLAPRLLSHVFNPAVHLWQRLITG